MCTTYPENLVKIGPLYSDTQLVSKRPIEEEDDERI